MISLREWDESLEKKKALRTSRGLEKRRERNWHGRRGSSPTLQKYINRWTEPILIIHVRRRSGDQRLPVEVGGLGPVANMGLPEPCLGGKVHANWFPAGELDPLDRLALEGRNCLGRQICWQHDAERFKAKVGQNETASHWKVRFTSLLYHISYILSISFN